MMSGTVYACGDSKEKFADILANCPLIEDVSSQLLGSSTFSLVAGRQKTMTAIPVQPFITSLGNWIVDAAATHVCGGVNQNQCTK